ncbi:MAG: SMC-Scp complex subunit ScpB [Planctomycetota bacterium]|nr:SMC-Scp complex subunit ScpB [Planctomycetota bacterium]
MSDSSTGEEMQVDQVEPAEDETAGTVEAILFASDKPLAAARISDICELGGVRVVRKAVENLNERYEQTGRVFRIVEIAGGYQMQTQPEYNEVISRLSASRRESRLSQAAMETLAVVAYRQPVLRADVEAIRGVACGEVLRGLMEKNLVRIAGRADEIGRPILYGTTKHFLEIFGLADLKGLPKIEQLRIPDVNAEKPPGQDAADQDDKDDDVEESEES